MGEGGDSEGLLLLQEGRSQRQERSVECKDAQHSLRGSAALSRDQLLEMLQNNPLVAYGGTMKRHFLKTV